MKLFDEAAALRFLPASIRERVCLRLYPETDSTNLRAREDAIQGAPEGTVVVALSQTAGRGRQGRSFFSPKDTGLYLSLVLRPALAPADALRITTGAAVAVCRALEHEFGLQPGIKWVNDVFLDERKVCGILTESALNGRGMLDFAILGIGLNVYPPEGGFPPEVAQTAGSILPRDTEYGRERLLASLLTEFFRLYDTIGTDAHMEEYRRRCFLIGREVDVHPGTPDSDIPPYRAAVLDVDSECRLVVRVPGMHPGEVAHIETLSTGEVRVRTRNGGTR